MKSYIKKGGVNGDPTKPRPNISPIGQRPQKTRKELGKITHARFGHCGYQKCQIGIELVLECELGTCVDVEAVWDHQKIGSKNKEWDETKRDEHSAKIVRGISKILDDAKVSDIQGLVGVPIEARFDGGRLIDFRVLTEVLLENTNA